MDINIICSFDSIVSQRLYENLKSQCYVPKNIKDVATDKIYKITYGVSELKILLNAVDTNNERISSLFHKVGPETDYDYLLDRVREIAKTETDPIIKRSITPKWEEWRDLRKALLKAINEINEKSELQVEMEPIKGKKGGRITSLEFTVSYKQDIDETNIVKEKKKKAAKKITPEESMKLLEEADEITDSIFSMKDLKSILAASDYNIDDIKKYPILDKQWFSDEIDQIALEQGVNVIDLFTPWRDICLAAPNAKVYYSSGVHQNAAGSEILAQMVAECMECSVDDVAVFGADTDASPYDSGSYASSTTYITGKAVEDAYNNMNEIKNKALNLVADDIELRKQEIFEANKQDLTEAKDNIPEALYNRLKLDENKMRDMIKGIRDVMNLPDPVGKKLLSRQLDEGLNLYKISCPIGVLGIIFKKVSFRGYLFPASSDIVGVRNKQRKTKPYERKLDIRWDPWNPI